MISVVFDSRTGKLVSGHLWRSLTNLVRAGLCCSGLHPLKTSKDGGCTTFLGNLFSSFTKLVLIRFLSIVWVSLISEWGRNPGDRGHREGRDTECHLHFSLPRPAFRNPWSPRPESMEREVVSLVKGDQIGGHLGKRGIHQSTGTNGSW